MEFITRPIEQRLWPKGHRLAPAPPALVAARFAYALVRDLTHGDLSLRAMSLVYTTMLAIVPLLAFALLGLEGAWGSIATSSRCCSASSHPLGPRAAELSARVVGFVDNVSGLALGSISVAILLYHRACRWRRRSKAASTSCGASTGREASRAGSAST